MQGRAAGHEPYPVLGDHIGDIVGDARPLALGGGEACAGGVEVEDPYAAGTDVAGVLHRPAADAVRRLAGLFLRGTGQGQLQGLPGEGVVHLHRVSHSVDGRVAGAAAGVHHNGPPAVQGKPRLPGQGRVRPDPRRHDHQIPLKHRPRGQGQVAALEGRRRVSHPQVHPVVQKLLVEDLDHVVVVSGEDLGGGLHQGHLVAGLPEVHRHFHADKPASHHGDSLRPALQGLVEPGDVRHGLYGEHLGLLEAGDGREHRLGPGGQHQLVVAFPHTPCRTPGPGQ